MKIIIPARKGSKGLPFKNRKLFKYTADSIPISLYDSVYVLTDDSEIIKMCEDEYDFNIIDRPRKVSNDIASTKLLMEYAIESIGFEKDEMIVLLYLTYPSRTWSEVEIAVDIFLRSGVSSLLCKKEINTSPFLILKEENNNKGSQLFYHNLYRRQDYPKCFEISHYICILKPSILDRLNENLYYRDTFFLKVDKDIIDIDSKKDLDLLNGK